MIAATARSSLARKVLGLPREEREELLAELLDSLRDDDGGEPDVPPEEWDEAWRDELARHVADLDAGKVETVPAEQVLDQLRRGVRPARRLARPLGALTGARPSPLRAGHASARGSRANEEATGRARHFAR